jgi:dehydrogenase/reductase SDR family member 7B
MRDYRESVVWITGASSGIGEALAYELAERGARLVLSARRAGKLEAVRARCANPLSHMVLPFDLTDHAALATRVARVLAERGRVDMLINNAGVSQRALAQETLLSVDRQIFETDYFAPVALVKAVLPSMIARRAGHLVAVSSVAGLVATPYRSSYSAAKAALHAFHDALRVETHEAGLKVSVLCPGFVATNIANAALVGDGSASAGRHEVPSSAMTAQLFARKAAAALAREEELIVLAGKEQLIWWLARLSPRAAGIALRHVKVV